MHMSEQPEVFMNVTQVIDHYGYTSENHEVTTADGYILSINRIPFGKDGVAGESRPVVFLQHGLLDSAFSWVINKPSGSLGFLLADHGYDVWLGNSRGNTYSRKHKTLSPETRAFWNFTWDEMAKYDLPACVDYILATTKASKLSYVGHSQGNEIAFAKLSENGPFNSKISSFVALAPIAYLRHLRVKMTPLVKIVGLLNEAVQLLKHGEFLQNSKFMSKLTKFFAITDKENIAFNNFIFLMYGISRIHLDENRLSIYDSHVPAGTSAKNMVHYAQSLKSKQFQMYDYGSIGNIRHYYSIHPPKYGLNIKDVPVALFYGGKDCAATPEDAASDLKDLGKALLFSKFLPDYTHQDFIWGDNASDVIYKDVISFIDSQNK